MTEESITLAVIRKLKDSGYRIITFDFPQSGTGVLLHSCERIGKNQHSIILDILARKGHGVLLLENKVRFSRSDAMKLRTIRDTSDYDQSLMRLGIDRLADQLKFGLSLEDSPFNQTAFDRHASDLNVLFLVGQHADALLVRGHLP